MSEAWAVRDEWQRRALIEHVQSLTLDKPVTVEIKQGVNRTKLQNSFLWGWIYTRLEAVLAEAGIVIPCDDGTEHPYTKDVLHEIFKRKFLVVGVVESKGRSLELYRSTTELTTAEFCDFVRSVRQFAWQFWEIQIPEPVGRFSADWQSWLDEAKSKGAA